MSRPYPATPCLSQAARRAPGPACGRRRGVAPRRL